jgi:glycosyltransferase involved in cell wall biosynthesis
VVRIAYVFGKPVVVSDVGSIPESVRHGVTGLIVPPGDDEALAAALLELLRDEARRTAMGRAAADMVSGDLSWDRIAERTETVYESVRRRERRASTATAPARPGGAS